jgi:nucleoside phosphorylase
MKKQLKYISNIDDISVKMMNYAHYYAESRAFESAKRINEIIGASAALNSAQSINEMIKTNAAFGSAQSINEMIKTNAAFGSAQSINEMIKTSAAFGSAQSINEIIKTSAAFGSARGIDVIIGASAALNSAQSINEMIKTNAAFGSAKSIDEMIKTCAAFGSAKSIDEIIGASAALNSAQSINEMIKTSAAFGSAQSINEMIKTSAAFGSAQSINEIIKISAAFGSAQSINEMWAKQIHANDLRLATISQYPLKDIALAQLSNDDAANLSKSFMDLFSDFQEKFDQTNIKCPTITSELEVRELFTATNLVKSILAKEPSGPSNEYDENEFIKDTISIETDDRLQMLLLEFDPQLISMWIGAKEAINSNNPDYARHFSVSLSELFANVLQRLAPDNEIVYWSDSLDDFKEGKPTNEARLRYIYREANDNSFGLTKKFISFALELMDFLNRGTHKSITNKVDKQFRMILMQFELVISHLIETSQPSNSLQLNNSNANNNSFSVNSIASDLIKDKTDANRSADDRNHGFDKNKFTIGLIAALPKEFAAIKSLLQDPKLYREPGVGAGRNYWLANLPAVDGGKHYLVLAFMVDTGNNMASTRATLLFEHFPEIRSIIMVGIAGGVPNHVKPKDHVRLGDVVISNKDGIVQYDLLKEGKEIVHRNPPRPPSSELLEAVCLLEAEEILCNRQWTKYIEIALDKMNISRPSDETDILTDSRDSSKVIPHPKDNNRTKNTPRIFFGPIASSNTLLKNPIKRDNLRNEFGVKAIEMEGSGIADAAWHCGKGYLVVRGICDYCDELKNDIWQEYAAVVASAVTRYLIESIPT